MLYIPVCICLRPAHGMRLWFPSVTTIKNIPIPEKKKKLCFNKIIFFFYIVIGYSYVSLSLSRLFVSRPGGVQCSNFQISVFFPTSS